jgi:hypothetical protein
MRQPVGTEALTSDGLLSNMSEGDISELKSTNDEKETPSTDVDTASSGSSQSDETHNASDGETDIPEEFPGREVLIAAGITKIADIPTTKEGLVKVEGMNARLANQIGVKLAQE